LSIEDKDIPMGYRIDATLQTVAPPLRGGVLASFPVHKLQAITGTVRMAVEGQPVVPQYGEFFIETDGARYESPLGRNGEFYFENLPEGSHSGTIEHEGRHCTVHITVPKSEEPLVKIGTVTCDAAAL